LFGLEGSLIPRPPHGGASKAFSVGEGEDSLAELGRLLSTAQVEVLGFQKVTVRRVHPGTYIGEGKLQEVHEARQACGADFVVFDMELSPNQMKNLEKRLSCPVLDRFAVILEIFSNHAQTSEAKTQVELARLQYLAPRLSHLWSHLERQSGRGGVGNRGMGEKQLEVDRRMMDRRAALLKKRLHRISGERSGRRKGRQNVKKVALVGYTNAGKSTLLNGLTRSQVVAEDKLFVTLDSSVRSLDPFSHPPVVAIDTVGFIRKLPTSLVASFRSTLEEAADADLLVHVADASSSSLAEEVQVTDQILHEMGIGDRPRLKVANKSDLVSGGAARNRLKAAWPGATWVSAHCEEDVTRLRDQVLAFFTDLMRVWEIVVPLGEGSLDAALHRYGKVEVVRYFEKGVFYRVRMDEAWAKKLGLHRFPPSGELS